MAHRVSGVIVPSRWRCSSALGMRAIVSFTSMRGSSSSRRLSPGFARVISRPSMPAARRTWTLGDRLTHRHNPEMGVGLVVEVQERAVVVEFPGGLRLRLAEASDALVPVAADGLSPTGRAGALVERLAAGEVDPLEDFAIRLDALHLAALREAGGLGSFLGGRVRLFPHQLHTAERASAADPLRWLLADEVGLGKTGQACPLPNPPRRTGRAERRPIGAPPTPPGQGARAGVAG